MKRFVRAAIFLLGAIAVASSAYAQQPATDPDIKGGAVNVVVKGGVVTLPGRVDTEKGKLRATTLTKKIKGVKTVDNGLVVGPPN